MRIYAVLALIALAPLELARWHYDRARLADVAGRSAEAEQEIAAAARLDPQFPLYPMRLALLRARRPEEGAAAAILARRAATLGGATPSLWLVAGILGYGAREPWAGSALEKACFLDPFNPFPPFYSLLADRASPEAPGRGAQALLNEPRLAAAVFWERHPDLLAESAAVVRGWPEVNTGWKQALLASIAAMPPPEARTGPTGRLALTIDSKQEESLALPAFRRRPWGTIWPLVEYRQRIWAGIRIPPAAASPGTSRRFIHAAPCRRSLSGQALLTH